VLNVKKCMCWCLSITEDAIIFLHKPAKYQGVQAIYMTLELKVLCSGTTHSVTDCHILNLYISFSKV